MTNKLFYGDNLEVLRGFPEASVDLVYLDPPFNSNAGYNVLFKSASGAGADASIEAFDDTWTWGDSSKEALLDIAGGTNRPLQVMMSAMHSAIGENPLMAYLAMMAVRLVELHRVLKPTGSLYLHCDPTASHYLKLVLDAVFGAENYRNEIIWRRYGSHNDVKHGYASVHDVIFFYVRSASAKFTKQFDEHDKEYLDRSYRHYDADGRRWRIQNASSPNPRPNLTYDYSALNGVTYRPHSNGWKYSRERMAELDAQDRLAYPSKPEGRLGVKNYLDEMKGVPLSDVWANVPSLSGSHAERLGYPTQKPRALLERIIAASSNPGDVVLDPFCGCGTAVDAAQKLGRSWIGIDITHVAIGMIENRMREGYPGIEFETIGVPKDLASAERLAEDDPHQFQQWVSWQVGGYPRDKKGGDKGVDGWFNYLAEGGKIETGVISVKAGNIVNPSMVRDLGDVMRRDQHRFGLFVMKAMPTKGMREAADAHPTIETEFGRFPAMQIVTLAELFMGKKPKLPPLISPVKKASRVETRASHAKGAQGALL